MNSKLIKTLCISFVIFFSVFFINTDNAKADIPYCSSDDDFSKAASCEYSAGVTTTMSLNVYFGKTTSGRYCAEIKNVKLHTWVDINESDKATNRGKVAFDLNDNTMSGVLNNNSCPRLKFVNEYSSMSTKTTKFTVSDKKLVDLPLIGDITDEVACGVNQVASSEVECWKADGKNFREITSEEMKKTIESSDKAREAENFEEQKKKIIIWGQNSGSNSASYEYGNCNVLSKNTIEFLTSLFSIISVVGIILLVIMSAVEFIKALTGSDEDGIKGAFKHTLIRMLCVVLLLLLPMIIGWILGMVNNNNYIYDKDGDIVIGDNNEPLCKVAE